MHIFSYSHTAVFHNFSSEASLLSVVLLIGVGGYIIGRTIAQYKHYRQPLTTLELRPHATNSQSPIAMEVLFKIIHNACLERSFGAQLFRLHTSMACEIVSSREQGIRFMVHVPPSIRQVLTRHLVAYEPNLEIHELDKTSFFADSTTGLKRVLSFKQAGHFSYPFKDENINTTHDPLAYVMESMTKLGAKEHISLQLLLSPAGEGVARRSQRLIQKYHALPFAMVRFSRLKRLSRLARWIFSPLWRLLLLLMTVLVWGHRSSSTVKTPRVRESTQASHESRQLIDRKLSQPLFYTTLRIAISAEDRESIASRRKGLRTAMSAYRVTKLQTLIDAPRRCPRIITRVRITLFNYRMPSLIKPGRMILSASEATALFHLPDTHTLHTENIVLAPSRTLPAPVSLKSDQKSVITLGMNKHQGRETPITISDEGRSRHVYIVGGTGNGKSTMLLGCIIQDIEKGRGLAVIDPHGDLAEMVLRHVPADRVNDVIYFNPDDLDYPIGINMLELPEGLTGNDLLREKDLVTESVVTIFRKLFSDDDSGGHRVEYILRNAVQTALTLPDATLFTVYDLLNDPTYRKTIARNLEDKRLRNFWWHEMGRAGDYQQVKMAAGVTAKIGRFLFSASARKILEQPRSTIDFDDVLKSQKILICNLSKGRIGEDTSTLFGTTLLSKLQIATLRRARQSAEDRQPFYLYVDEFQNFATTAFVQLLSEARKYRLALIMAEQSTAQQSDSRMTQVVLANVGTLVCFRTASTLDEEVLLPSLSPYIQRGEIASLSAYKFFVKLFQKESEAPLSGHTMLIQKEGSERIAQCAIEASREQYVIPEPLQPDIDMTSSTTASHPVANGPVYKVPSPQKV